MLYVYRITYPNGKIYIGQDASENFMTYFGSSENTERIEREHTPEQKRDFTVRKEILWSSDNAVKSELNQKEIELIEKYEANNPATGYNLLPKFKP